MLDEVLGAEFAEVRILVELTRVQVEEHIAQLVLNIVEGMNSTTVTSHGDKGVVRRWAESPRGVLCEVRGLIRRGFRHQLNVHGRKL